MPKDALEARSALAASDLPDPSRIIPGSARIPPGSRVDDDPLGHTAPVQALLDTSPPEAPTYAGNDPVNKVDPSGLAWDPINGALGFFGQEELAACRKASKSETLCVNLARFSKDAIDLSISFYNNQLSGNGSSDAWRHVFWSHGMVTFAKGQGFTTVKARSIALKIGIAHEKASPAPAPQTALAKRMDLRNNVVGRFLAPTNESVQWANVGADGRSYYYYAVKDRVVNALSIGRAYVFVDPTDASKGLRYSDPRDNPCVAMRSCQVAAGNIKMVR